MYRLIVVQDGGIEVVNDETLGEDDLDGFRRSLFGEYSSEDEAYAAADVARAAVCAIEYGQTAVGLRVILAFCRAEL